MAKTLERFLSAGGLSVALVDLLVAKLSGSLTGLPDCDPKLLDSVIRIVPGKFGLGH